MINQMRAKYREEALDELQDYERHKMQLQQDQDMKLSILSTTSKTAMTRKRLKFL